MIDNKEVIDATDIIMMYAYLDALMEHLFTMDWYEGDYNGEDSKDYLSFERSILLVWNKVKELDPKFELCDGFGYLNFTKDDFVNNRISQILNKNHPEWLQLS